MRLEDVQESQNIEDRRGEGGSKWGGKGGLGLSTIIILTLIGWVTGINPSFLITGAEMVSRQTAPSYSASRPTPQQNKTTQNEPLRVFVARVLKTNEDVWIKELPKQRNIPFQKSPLVLYRGGTSSGCGAAQSAMGPFYCPNDRKIYLDMGFFEEMRSQLRAGGDFAYAYVIAHEMGHHIEHLLGILERVHNARQRLTRREANALSVRVELMADCLAGVWAHHADQRWRILEQGDIEEAVNAASAIGDDRLQKQAQGYVVPDSFTHGSSAQRVEWLKRGLDSGEIKSCDTFRNKS